MKPASEIIELDPPLTATAPVATSREPSKLVDYYELTKPRMNFLVVVTTMVGFYVAAGAARVRVDWMLLFNTLLGPAACAAAAAILNQVIERDYDKLMPRTRNRPLPAGRIATSDALL